MWKWMHKQNHSVSLVIKEMKKIKQDTVLIGLAEVFKALQSPVLATCVLSC